MGEAEPRQAITCSGMHCVKLQPLLALYGSDFKTAVMDGVAATGDEELFARVDAYDWAGDQEFSSGMRAVLNPSMSPEQVINTTLRARCFYFRRYLMVLLIFEHSI